MAKRKSKAATNDTPATSVETMEIATGASDSQHLTDFDTSLFSAGKHYQLYNKLGAHVQSDGTHFGVWAPNARLVSVVGNFNGWDPAANPLSSRWDNSGIWEGKISSVTKGELYKFHIESHNGYRVEKADPYGFYMETPPATASIVWDLEYKWDDKEWMKKRMERKSPEPLSIYELHIGSWKRPGDDPHRYLSYRDLAAVLPAYCHERGFGYVEFMPVMEHPFYGSWGYQITGYFAPSSRFGTPQDFMFLVNELHRNNIGVILDWVPSHFPEDMHGLGYFDGTHLYEHEDKRKGFHPDWKSLIFNYERNEVKAFLISNALYWLDKFHIDGLRVDAVASMLYLDYSRNHGEWIPNIYGGRENLEAIAFLREFNDAVHQHFPDTITIAEESTAWPGVTKKTTEGGLGFDYKWMMGWMHDTLSYFHLDPVYRSFNQNMITFSLHYAFTEKYILPLSHDEVVYGKGSLLNKMPGDEWQRFANLRLLMGYMYGHPGGKLIFMGGEYGQAAEWRHDHSLDWHEEINLYQAGMKKAITDLNLLYKNEIALRENNYSHDGFEWIEYNDSQNSILSWIRKANDRKDDLVFVANFTPVVRHNYRIGINEAGDYQEILNTDNLKYAGSDVKNDIVSAKPIAKHGRRFSLSITVPPLAVIVLKKGR